LLAHTTNVIISDLIEPFFVLAVYGLTLAEDLGVGRYDAVFCWVRLHNLELNTTHSAACKKGVALTDGTISFEKIWLQVYVEEVAADALNGITEGEDMDALAIFYIGALLFEKVFAQGKE
jgi:hypothetical protein